MSTSSPIINQNIEIVTVLCPRAVSFSGLLSRLQSVYPTTGWTEQLLTLRLTQGVRAGRFTKIGSNPAGPVEGYGINPNMLQLNAPQNAIYEPFCSRVRPLGCENCGEASSGSNA